MLEKLLLKRTRRVKLNLDALKRATAGEKLLAAASGIQAGKGGDKTLSPSALTRYLCGERNPALKDALAIAASIGVDPVELIVGYAEDKRIKTSSWQDEALAKSQPIIGIDMPSFMRHFGHILKLLHLGYVVEGGAHRYAVKSAGYETGFTTVEIEAEKSGVPFEIRMLFALPVGRGIPIIVEFGRITVEKNNVTGVDVWTLKEETARLQKGGARFGARFWLQGPPMTFYFISEKPFTIIYGDGPLRAERGKYDKSAVTFYPSVFHSRGV